MPRADVGAITYPARVRESYAQDLLARSTPRRSARAGFRIVVDYGYSAASFVLPLVLGPLGVEAVSAHGFATERRRRRADARARRSGRRSASSSAVGADLGVVFDRAAERLYLIDEQGREIPVEQTLLLFLRLISRSGRQGKARVPDHGHEPGRASSSRAAGSRSSARPPRSPTLTQAAAAGRRRLRGRGRRRLRLPGVPARLRRGREPLQAARAARAGRAAALRARRRAAAADARPPAARVPVGAEGLVMRVLNERLQGPRPRPHRRDQGLRRARLGRRCCPTPTSRSSTSTPRARRPRSRPSSRRSSARWSRRSCRAGSRRGANLGRTSS